MITMDVHARGSEEPEPEPELAMHLELETAEDPTESLSRGVQRLSLFQPIEPASPSKTQGAEGTDGPITPPTSPVLPEEECFKDQGLELRDDQIYSETVTVFDWDDTLLATTVLTRQYCFDLRETRLPSWLTTQLQHVEDAAIAALTEAVRCSDRVVILTNAGDGWVEHSAQRFLPRVLEILRQLRIPIVSAQVEYSGRFPGVPSQWKKHAFLERFGPLDGEGLNLISIGDANFERLATKLAGAAYKRNGHLRFAKTVKFVEQPTLEKLEAQLLVLAQTLRTMCMTPQSVDWNMSVQRQNQEEVQPGTIPPMTATLDLVEVPLIM